MRFSRRGTLQLAQATYLLTALLAAGGGILIALKQAENAAELLTWLVLGGAGFVLVMMIVRTLLSAALVLFRIYDSTAEIAEHSASVSLNTSPRTHANQEAVRVGPQARSPPHPGGGGLT